MPATAGDEAMTTHGSHKKPARRPPAPKGHEPAAPATTDDGAGEGLGLAFRVTRPQLAAASFMSVVILAAGLVLAASVANLGIGARDAGGAVMPPGMIMTRDTPAQAMRDMAAVDPDALTYRAPVDARGDQLLEPTMDGDVKVFQLEASVIEWNILDYERVMAYAFNHQVPGPRIRLTVGDRVRIRITNHLPEPTTVHWHGLIVPNAMDGSGGDHAGSDPARRLVRLRVHCPPGGDVLLPLAQPC